MSFTHWHKLICKIIGHRSIVIFTYTYKWDHDNWAQTSTVYECECCGHRKHTDYQQPV